MEMEFNKKYEHEETRRLLKEVREFLWEKLRLVVPESTYIQTTSAQQNGRDPVEFFLIEQKDKPVYAACGGRDDLEKVLDLFDQTLEELVDHFDDLLDRNGGLDGESIESLNCYANAVDKCINVYKTQRRKRMTQFQKLDTIAELQGELQLLFSEILSKYIIVPLCDALYERVKNGSGQIYEMVVREVNGFLAGLGVYTKAVAPGEIIDPEWMEPTSDSMENFTDDFQKFDTVDKISRYPYLFTDGAKIIDGRVRIWRRRD